MSYYDFDMIIIKSWNFFTSAKRGMYVEIIENKCEGLVRLRDMDDDYYFFDEENFCIKGKRRGNKYTLGDTVKIIINRVDLVKKQLDFLLVS